MEVLPGRSAGWRPQVEGLLPGVLQGLVLGTQMPVRPRKGAL